MTYQTVEVDLDHGRVRPRGSESLPTKARALLTILASAGSGEAAPEHAPGAGLRRLLARPDFPLSPEQFQASMTADFWEQ